MRVLYDSPPAAHLPPCISPRRPGTRCQLRTDWPHGSHPRARAAHGNYFRGSPRRPGAGSHPPPHVRHRGLRLSLPRDPRPAPPHRPPRPLHHPQRLGPLGKRTPPMNGWDSPDIAEWREYERSQRRWWAEHFPAERGPRDDRCRRGWPGDCRRGGAWHGSHLCARPVSHAPACANSPRCPGCMCYCGEWGPPDRDPLHAARPLPQGVQEAML